MCGIWGSLQKHSQLSPSQLYALFSKIKHRGPDRSAFLEMKEFIDVFIGFHRLAIRDKSRNGDQPFITECESKTTYTICNGEIYNYKDLERKYPDFNPNSTSDCEIIPYIYLNHGLEQLLNDLNGEYAIAIIEIYHNIDEIEIKLIRDRLGIRPLFYSYIDNEAFSFCSEMKGLKGLGKIEQLNAGSYIEGIIDTGGFSFRRNSYYSFEYPICNIEMYIGDVLGNVREKLINSVQMMLDTDRPLGALLSGGLDSSLVVSIASMELKKRGKVLNTFSIGMKGATDKEYAEMVAEYCGTNHTHIELTNEQFLNAIEEVIYTSETFDITTVRATTGQYLVSKWIAENTDIKVLLIGDGSDELTGGYLYFHNAPNEIEFHMENCKLLEEIHRYDVLRADRGIAGNGLEARVPFLNYEFVDYYMSINPTLRMAKGCIEKYLLRKSFEGYLPDVVLYRKKEAFSDGVSGKEKSWFVMIQEMVEGMYDEKEFEKRCGMHEHCTPVSKEALFYREIYERDYSGCVIVDKFWLPNWSGGVREPSARVLGVY